MINEEEQLRTDIYFLKDEIRYITQLIAQELSQKNPAEFELQELEGRLGNLQIDLLEAEYSLDEILSNQAGC